MRRRRQVRVHMKAPGRIELPHKGFADLSLTAWVRRQNRALKTGDFEALQEPVTLVDFALKRNKLPE